jgi:alpha-1,6-mannosyltransferase
MLRDPDLRRRLLERCGLAEDGLLLLGVGRHAPEKRWPMVIEAVMSAGCACPVGLVLVGNGRERTRIVRLIGDNPHVHLLAPIADRCGLARLMASADALVHGCEAETFCMVAAEAAASGLPLIVPDRGGASDQARVEIGDVTYSAGQAASLAAAIERFGRKRVGAIAGRPASASARSMDDHFASLFVHYEGLRMPLRVAA